MANDPSGFARLNAQIASLSKRLDEALAPSRPPEPPPGPGSRANRSRFRGSAFDPGFERRDDRDNFASRRRGVDALLNPQLDDILRPRLGAASGTGSVFRDRGSVLGPASGTGSVFSQRTRRSNRRRGR